MLYSGADGEPVEVFPFSEICTGVGRWRRVVLGGGGCCRSRVIQVRWRLRVLRLLGGWIELERPGAAAVVIGELGSMAEGARGVSPTDG